MATSCEQYQELDSQKVAEDKEEYELAELLKKNCDKNGEEIEPAKSAPIFNRLGLLYQIKNAKLSLIKSAALFNAALVRTHSKDVMQQIEDNLKQLCSHILIKAGAKNKAADLKQIAQSVKKEIKLMRNKVEEELLEIPQITEKTIISRNVEAVEQSKAKKVLVLQTNIAKEYTSIMANVAHICEGVMGNPPCNYAIVGMGSLARQETTPYSDFEHIIILENMKSFKQKLKYFKWFSVIFHVIIINLQETIVPSVMLDSWKDDQSRFGDWYFDSVTTNGIAFDGMMPYASKFPLGRQTLTKDKQFKTELIKPVDEMLKYLNSEEILKNGYHLGDILTKICHVYGNERLFNQFQSGVQRIILNQSDEDLSQIKNQVAKDMEKFATFSYVKKNLNGEGKINVKKVIYRSTTLFITALGRYHKVVATSCFDIVDELEQKKFIVQKVAQKLRYAVAIACEIRLKWYMRNRSQRDIIDVSASPKENIFSGIVGIPSTISYFQIAYALQSEVAIRFRLKIFDLFYSHPRLLNVNLCLMFDKKAPLQFLLKSQLHLTGEIHRRYPFKRLYNFEECFHEFEKISLAQITDFTKVSAEESQQKIAENINSFAQFLTMDGHYDDAIWYYETIDKMWNEIEENLSQTPEKVLFDHKKCVQVHFSFHEKICSNIFQEYICKTPEQNTLQLFFDDKNVVNGRKLMHSFNMGSCFFNLNKPDQALQHFKKALEMLLMLRWSKNEGLDLAYDEFTLSNTLNKIARCFLRRKCFSEACCYGRWAINVLRKSPRPDSNSPLTLYFDIYLSEAFFVLGAGLTAQEKIVSGRKYLQKALTLAKTDRKARTGSATNFKPISLYQNEANIAKEIAKSYLKEKSSAYAIEHSDEILKCIDDWRLNYSDKQFGIDLHEIGKYLLKEKEFKKAFEFLEASSDMLEKLSKDYETDPILADVLQDMANCCYALKNFEKALKSFNSCLYIRQQIPENPPPSKADADNYFKLGVCCIFSDQIPRALACLNAFLQIITKFSSNNTQHKIDFYRILSRHYMQMDKYADAKKSLKLMLQWVENISSDIEADCEFASIYCDLGWCCYKSKNLSKTKEFLKKALEFQMTHAYVETTCLQVQETASSNDVKSAEKIVKILELMSMCWIKLNKHCEAMECLDRYLTIKKFYF